MTEAERYKLLYEIARTLHAQNLDLPSTLETIIAHTGQALNVQYGCLMTFKDQAQVEHVYVLGAQNAEEIDPRLWDMLLKRGVIGYVYHRDRSVVIRNINNDPRWSGTPEASFLPRTGSAISVPLSKGTYIYGVMLFVHPEVDYFKQPQIELLEEIGHVASLAIGNAQELHAARSGDTRYHALFEGAIVPIILTDLQGFIVDVNQKACQFLGFLRGDLLHVPITDIHETALGKQQLNELDEYEETSFHTRLHDVEGRPIAALIRLRRVRLENRSLIEWVMQDTSAQAELDRLRRDLAAMVYHDLRGPLNNIIASIHKLPSLMPNHDNMAVLKLLNLGLQSTRQLQRMVDSLLDIQRMEEGNSLINRQPVEVRVLVADAVQLVQPLAQDAEQVLTFEVSKDLPIMALDSDMLLRVIVNLMENAIKYTPFGGSIHVTATQDQHFLQVKITDSGPGIVPEMLDRIFDKFSRVKHQDAPKGVGLGLAFCRLAVEAHGGNIWVESEVGHGSDFIFRLPIVTPTTIPEEAEGKAPFVDPPVKPKNSGKAVATA